VVERINHGACGKWWTGIHLGHCGACHETFTGSAFDAHQTLEGGHVSCSTDKLQPVWQPWGILWRLKMTPARQRSLDKLRDG
jgi:hypothetical protein